MSIEYKFKKEKVDDGFVSRPRIIVELIGKHGVSIEIPALIDSGCDITVIPEGIAEAIGLKTKGKKTELHGHRGSSPAIPSKTTIKFISRVRRNSMTLRNVPILISLREDDAEEEQDITLGVERIFDHFDINFKKSQNKIIFKKSKKNTRIKRP